MGKDALKQLLMRLTSPTAHATHCKLCVGADRTAAAAASACSTCTDTNKELKKQLRVARSDPVKLSLAIVKEETPREKLQRVNLATKIPPRKDVLMVCNVVRLLPLPEQQKKRKKEENRSAMMPRAAL